MEHTNPTQGDTALVILAAGLGSRYGGVKQLEAVGPGGEVIIDYSIHDALAAGFNKIVFILRRDIFDDFHEVMGRRMEELFRARGVRWEYVFQELVDAPAGRSKPWGTGQAVLACKSVLAEPFAVINADDYYGREAFVRAYDFLQSVRGASYRYGMIGFILRNTLSDVGGVTRGICATVDGRLTGIDETKNIVKTPDGAAAQTADGLRPLDIESLVSMNMWMFTPEFVGELETGFPKFRAAMTDPLKDEYLLPTIVDGLLADGRCAVDVLPTNDRWFGMTYREDLPEVRRELAALHGNGTYPAPLFSDV